MNQSLGLISLVVREYEEAQAFFVGKLGFDLVEDRYIPEQDLRWVAIAPPSKIPGARILLAKASSPDQAQRIGSQSGGRVFLFLYTDDFWRDHERFTKQGVQFDRALTEQPYGTVAVFEDLYGNPWDLVQSRDRAGGA